MQSNFDENINFGDAPVDAFGSVVEKLEDLAEEGGPNVSPQTQGFVEMLGRLYDYVCFKLDNFEQTDRDYTQNKDDDSKNL